MIIHCTKKLSGKLSDVSTVPLIEIHPFGSWHGHLHIINGRNCLLLCHDKTRFPLFMNGLTKKEFSNLDYLFQDLFMNTLLKLDYPTTLLEKATKLMSPLQFDTSCDRSVQSTLRTLFLHDLQGFLWDVPNVMDLGMYSVSARLCQRPVRTKGMKASECLWPDRAMKEFLQSFF